MPRIATPTFTEFAAEWLSVQRVSGKSPGTVRNYETHLRLWLLPEFGDRHLGSLTKRDLFMFTNALATRTGAVNRARIYHTFQVIMKSAADDFELIPPWTVSIKGVGGDKSQRPSEFTMEQALAVVGLMPQYQQDALKVAIGAALRVGELTGLNLGDWDPESGALTIARQFRADREIAPTKTGAVATVYPIGEAVEILNRRHATRRVWETDDHPMFPSTHHTRLTSSRIRTEWVKAKRWARVRDIRVHDLRHVGLTAYAMIPGVTLADIQSHGRHKDPKSSMRYLHAQEASRRRMLSQAYQATPAA